MARLRRLLYPRADMVTVQAEATAGPFARQVPGIKRLAVIPNPCLRPCSTHRWSRSVTAARASCWRWGGWCRTSSSIC